MRVALTLFISVAALPQTPSLEALLEKVHTYLDDYEIQISELMADEVMTQTFAKPTQTPGMTTTWRRLDSEIAFMRLPGKGAWLGYRNVRVINNKPVADPQSLLAALQPGSANERDRALQLATESARFNLGNARTTNVPTLLLELVHRRNRDHFKFEIHGTERLRGQRVRKMAFEEILRPTLIRTPKGGDVMSSGTIWVEETSGRVFEAEVRCVDGSVSKWRKPPETVLRVSFAPHAALGMLLPDKMIERFPIGVLAGAGEARYKNFRKFTTSARIVPE